MEDGDEADEQEDDEDQQQLQQEEEDDMMRWQCGNSCGAEGDAEDLEAEGWTACSFCDDGIWSCAERECQEFLEKHELECRKRSAAEA
jgi:hypothetical protein